MTDKVQDMESRMVNVNQLQVRATKAEEEQERVKRELEVSVGHAKVLAIDKKNLEKDMGGLFRHVDSRNAQLKSS